MTELIEIYWSTGSIDEARKVARYLCQEKYVASAQIIPWTESISLLNGQLETSQESKVIFETRLERFEEIKKIILENCNYQLPQITYRKIDGGNQEYLDWIALEPSFK